MLMIMTACFVGQQVIFNFPWVYDDDVKYPTLVCVGLFAVLMFFPMNMMFRPIAKWEITKAVGNILIAPFGDVKFRHFFLADIFTSVKISFVDASGMVCFFTSGDFDSEQPATNCYWYADAIYAF